MKSTVAAFTCLLLGIFTSGSAIAQTQSAVFVGRVQRVWEDGFQLKTENRSITVDSYYICGDNTTGYITVGEKVTVKGEFDEGEFDAFSVKKASGKSICR